MKMKIIRKNRSCDSDVDIDINTQNIACLGKAMPILNKQHLSNI